MPASFVHLRLHSAYSLLEGALRIPEAVKLAVKHEMPALGITDRDNLFGSAEFSAEAAAKGVQPIIGCQLSFRPAVQSRLGQPEQLLLYAKDEAGYRNLLALASRAYLDPAGGQGPRLDYSYLAQHAEGLMVLTGGPHGAIGRALSAGKKDEAREKLDELRAVFPDRVYVELMRHGLSDERLIEPGLIELALDYEVPLIATNDIYFDGGEETYRAHDALLCISEGRYVTEDDRRRVTPEHRFKSPEEMRLLFADLPEATENTLVFAERCAVMSPKRKPILPGFSEISVNGAASDESEEAALRRRAAEGLAHRLETLVFTEAMDAATRAEIAKPYEERLAFELDVIVGMQFPGYFLIVSDFITWSKRQGIPVGPGRGSGAASVVAWSLLITDLDPLKYDLIFERFLNPERVSMPDFDIDFCQDRRDEVIRYVQGRYGADRVAQIITFGKLQARAVLRDVGRVLQMPYGQVDRICKLVPNNPANPVTLEQALEIEPMLKRMRQEDESVDKLISTALKLEGLYRHASTHAAGVVIADRGLSELVPMYRDPKSDMPVVQYSMKYAETSGLVKFDFLGLKTLSVLDHAVRHVAKRGIVLDLLKLPEGDPRTYAMLSRGETVGIFQFESAGMRDALRKLKPDALDDLIALGALYRPGPMDNIPMYIARKHGREKPDYMHPMLEPVLKETFGVIIYQEQVQQIAQVLAGYTLGGADLLRRAMGKKIKEEMQAQRATFIDGAAKNAVSAQKAGEIFDLVDKFAGYGFNKAHAAAYALIGYQTAYLKANYPVEFMAASMTFDLHNTDKLAIFAEDARKLGICVLPPDINASHSVFAVEDEGGKLCVRYALGAIKNVGAAAMAGIVAEREHGGRFASLYDFAGRIDPQLLGRRQMEQLVRAGAFDSLHPNRRQLFESLDLLLAYGAAIHQEKESNQINLFGEPKDAHPEPALPVVPDWAVLNRLENEFAAIGFYLSTHPLEGYDAVLQRLGIVTHAKMCERLPRATVNENGRPSGYTAVNLAGIVTAVKIKSSDKGRFAFVQLSDKTAVYEVSIFDETVLDTRRDLLHSGAMIAVKAEAKMEESGPRIIALNISKLDDVAEGAPSARSVTITLSSPEGLAPLRQLLARPVERGSQVRLRTKAEDEWVEIELDRRYAISAGELGALRSREGIAEIAEA